MGNWTVVKCSCGKDAMVSLSELDLIGQGVCNECIDTTGRIRRLNVLMSAMKHHRPTRTVQFFRNKIEAGFYEQNAVRKELVNKIVNKEFKDGFIVA